ncbi:LLM class F420-dependent oxidoreductase [Amycolatopsis tucumanensis]|uniref:LLM class F420-dependent oxidoreductase n=1 Tax=Amycolatopsis tucumanensis TaxID=401106 RepID=UPI003D721BFE
MAIELGKIGIWRGWHQLNADLAREAERLGFGAIWIGGSPDGQLTIVDELLDATENIKVATGIVNMWKDDAATVGASWNRIEAEHPGRFLLGVGIGHPEAHQEYQKPYDKIVDYLDGLDQAGVPVAARALAALGPKVLKLSAERTAGAHPYLTTPEHTKEARRVLGDGVLLAPEQKVVLETDPEKARAIARPTIEHPYLHLVNYRSNLLRHGWSEADLDNGGSDALIDALALHGDIDSIAAGITAHLDAGADHVCVQVLGDDPLPGYRAISEALLS